MCSKFAKYIFDNAGALNLVFDALYFCASISHGMGNSPLCMGENVRLSKVGWSRDGGVGQRIYMGVVGLGWVRVGLRELGMVYSLLCPKRDR